MKLAYTVAYLQLVYWIVCIIAKLVVADIDVRLVHKSKALILEAVKSGIRMVYFANH